MRPGEVVIRLTALGYRFEVVGDKVRWRYEGTGKPDPAQVQPLLGAVKAHKAVVIGFLAQKAQALERTLTCHECTLFRPAVNSPNPTQAWGYCRKRGRGRYAVAMACEAIMISGNP